MAGITCDRAHDLLKRTDSAPVGMDSSDTLVKGDYVCKLSAEDVVLEPGRNDFQLTMKVGVVLCVKVVPQLPLASPCVFSEHTHPLPSPMDAFDCHFDMNKS